MNDIESELDAEPAPLDYDKLITPVSSIAHAVLEQVDNMWLIRDTSDSKESLQQTLDELIGAGENAKLATANDIWEIINSGGHVDFPDHDGRDLAIDEDT